jgi:hypothetical protein
MIPEDRVNMKMYLDNQGIMMLVNKIFLSGIFIHPCSDPGTDPDQGFIPKRRQHEQI